MSLQSNVLRGQIGMTPLELNLPPILGDVLGSGPGLLRPKNRGAPFPVRVRCIEPCPRECVICLRPARAIEIRIDFCFPQPRPEENSHCLS
jgi:hypothetical protein